MSELLRESLKVSDCFMAYHRALIAHTKKGGKGMVKSEKLDRLYLATVEQCAKVAALRRDIAETN